MIVTISTHRAVMLPAGQYCRGAIIGTRIMIFSFRLDFDRSWHRVGSFHGVYLLSCVGTNYDCQEQEHIVQSHSSLTASYVSFLMLPPDQWCFPAFRPNT